MKLVNVFYRCAVCEVTEIAYRKVKSAPVEITAYCSKCKSETFFKMVGIKIEVVANVWDFWHGEQISIVKQKDGTFHAKLPIGIGFRTGSKVKIIVETLKE